MSREPSWQHVRQLELNGLALAEGIDLADTSKGSNGEGTQNEEKESIPESGRLIDIEKEIANSLELCEAIFYAYEKAIKRRNRVPLSKDRFDQHFFEGGAAKKQMAFGDPHRGYILGVVNNDMGIFTPTHFAPFSLRSGYDLMQELGKSNMIPSIIAITEDLRATLSKMPCWHDIPQSISILQQFHTGEVFRKVIMFNDFFNTPDGRILALRLMSPDVQSKMENSLQVLS